MKSIPFAFAVSSLAVAGCGDSVPAQGSARPTALPPVVATSVARSSAAVADELSTVPPELLKLRFTSDVKNREPVDKLDHATPGKRVYAHLSVRNRSGRPRTLTLAFSVNGKPASTVDLVVETSWEWRTWAYNTVPTSEKAGTLSLSITDDEGHPLAEERLPIR